MDKRLLEIVCCPITHKGLAVAGADLLSRVNEAIAGGHLHNRAGQPLVDELAEALVTDDQKSIYPVNDGIPVLLEGESIALDQLESHA